MLERTAEKTEILERRVTELQNQLTNCEKSLKDSLDNVSSLESCSNILEAELQSVKTELELAIFELETVTISDTYLTDELCSPSFVFLSFL